LFTGANDPGGILVVLERGQGAWVERQRLTVPRTLGRLAVADLNGDGVKDITGCESYVDYPATDAISVFMGEGPFQFAEPTAVPVGLSPVAAELADVDGDGAIDLTVAVHGCHCYPGNEAFLAVLRGNGDGSFADPTLTSVGHYARDVALIDMNGDTHLDAVVACQATRTSLGYSIYLGSGNGSFTLEAAVDAAHIIEILRGDLDGDGEDELLLVGDVFLSLPVGDPGCFEDPDRLLSIMECTGAAVGDVTGDGVPDLVAMQSSWDHAVNDRLLLFPGLRGGGFPEEGVAVLSGLGPRSVRIGSVASGEAPVVTVAGSASEDCSNFLVSVPLSAFQRDAAFIRGDANTDGVVDLSDAVATLLYLFGEKRLSCEKAIDANDDGSLDVADAVYTLMYLFGAGEPPPDPHETAGGDPTEDTLSCAAYKEE
jgi:hypothetical protein